MNKNYTNTLICNTQVLTLLLSALLNQKFSALYGIFCRASIDLSVIGNPRYIYANTRVIRRNPYDLLGNLGITPQI